MEYNMSMVCCSKGEKYYNSSSSSARICIAELQFIDIKIYSGLLQIFSGQNPLIYYEILFL